MKENGKLIDSLSPSLFWDVDASSLDSTKHASYIIERVLNMGTMEDFQLIKNYYGKEKIKDISQNLRYMDNRLLHFCSAYFNVPLNSFRCYTLRLSQQTHWNY